MPNVHPPRASTSDKSSLRLALGANEVIATTTTSTFPLLLLDQHEPATSLLTAETPASALLLLLQVPAVWSMFMMLSIVLLLYGWEKSVETVREVLDETLLPVIESMLSEVAGLGFIGLVLEALVFPFRDVIGHVSEYYLGEEEILLEDFEFLHSAFFQVGIAFFAMSGLMVAESLAKIRKIRALQGIGLDEQGDCTATEQGLADIMQAQTLPADSNVSLSDEEALRLIPRTTWRDELKLSSDQQGAEALVMREYLVRQGKLNEKDVINFEGAFRESLMKLAEISPLSWVPLIPALALANSVDISHNVINAASPNAAETSGFFFSSPEALVPSVALSLFCMAWGAWNFWKMSTVKNEIIPTVVLDNATNEARLLPPRCMNPSQRQTFTSTPAFMQPVESLWASEANDHNNIFGTVGDEVYLASIRFHTWVCTSQIFFYTSQILARDAIAVVRGLPVGNPQALVPELVTYGLLVAAAMAQLVLAPRTL